MKKNKNYVDLKDQPVPEGQHLLEVDDLKMYFHTEDGVVRAVDGVSYTLDRGETLGVVGESGSGKSVTAMTIMGLISMPPGKIEGGDVRYRGRSILEMTEEEMQHIRGNDIAMIFQDPMTSLNPVYKIGKQVGEGLRLHRGYSKQEALKRATELLDLVGIPEPEKRVNEYPHQFSGGMRQRVMIAMALACDPDILIADEPTTALDVTIQAQIIELMQEMQEQNICLFALKRSNSKENWTKSVRQLIFKQRRRVETVFSQLTGQLNAERVLAKSFQGLCTRLVNKVLAYNLCIALNSIFNEPCELGKIKELIF